MINTNFYEKNIGKIKTSKERYQEIVELLEKDGKCMLAYARSLFKSHEDAEDVMSIIKYKLLSAHKGQGKLFDNEHEPLHYVKRCIKNIQKDVYMDPDKEDPTDPIDNFSGYPDTSESPSEIHINKERGSLPNTINKYLKMLDKKDREIIENFFGLNGKSKSVKQMAEEYGVSPAAISQKKGRILEKLRVLPGFAEWCNEYYTDNYDFYVNPEGTKTSKVYKKSNY